MENFIRSLKVFWRSERLLKQNELRLAAHKITLNALAGLVALFGLVMLSISVFFALVPYMGQAFAALTVCGADFVLAVVLVVYARTLKPAPEIKMVKEMRDMALTNIEDEVAHAEVELTRLKLDLQKFLRNPVDALLPAAAGPLLSAAIRGLRTTKRQPEKSTHAKADEK